MKTIAQGCNPLPAQVGSECDYECIAAIEMSAGDGVDGSVRRDCWSDIESHAVGSADICAGNSLGARWPRQLGRAKRSETTRVRRWRISRGQGLVTYHR